MPATFAELTAVFERLERHYGDMQDIEFTVQNGRLWVLQTRNGKRTTQAALQIAVDMAQEGKIDRDQAIARIEPATLEQSLHPMLDPDAPRDVIAHGLPASPGAVSGQVVFSADEAERLGAAGEAVILVRIETSPEDIHGMHAARGILTARGGMTSHAAVVARGMGKPCVCAAAGLVIDYRAGSPHRGGPHRRQGRSDHHRRQRRRRHAGHRADGGAAAFRRLRYPDGLGRRAPPDEGAHQRRDARAMRAPRSASAPRASACAAPSTCSSTASASSRCAR